MSRYNTQVLSSIRMLCRMRNINEKVLYERAKLILSIYREVCWSTIDRANDVCDTLICTYGDSLDGALIYLENFAPDEARERFEERIRSLFETKWIIELVDMAMLKIREYPDKGALYCEIISKAYLNRFKYRESEMLEVLNMERSTYYDRKKEAILLFGLSLWGTAIPKLKDFLESAREEEALPPWSGQWQIIPTCFWWHRSPWTPPSRSRQTCSATAWWPRSSRCCASPGTL